MSAAAGGRLEETCAPKQVRRGRYKAIAARPVGAHLTRLVGLARNPSQLMLNERKTLSHQEWPHAQQ